MGVVRRWFISWNNSRASTYLLLVLRENGSQGVIPYLALIIEDSKHHHE
jgi:hypothetical protein